MSHLNAPDYYRRREQQERALAGTAASAAISAIHVELADRYAGLVENAEAPLERHQLRLVNA